MKGKAVKERGLEFEAWSSKLLAPATLNTKHQAPDWFAPCAGITLIRFYGFDLSLLPPDGEIQHPGNTEKFIIGAKVKEKIFCAVTFIPCPS
jgi:hypothetical protein